MLVVDLEGASVPPAARKARAGCAGRHPMEAVEAQALLSALHVDGLVKAAATIRWTRAVSISGQ